MFLNPMNLAFLGAAVIPLVLHLLSRSRQVSVKWGAMMFLVQGEPRRAKLRKLREWSVLGLRCLAIALLALALARPVAGVGAGSLTLGDVMSMGKAAGGGRAVVAVVVDVSGSTSAPATPGTTRLDAVKEAASRVLASLSEEDQAALLTSDGRESGGFTSDRVALSSRLAALRSGAGALDVPAALEGAAKLLGSRPGYPVERRIIALVTDRQMSSYGGVTEAFAKRFEGVREGAGVARVVVIPAGDTDRDNAWVKSVEITSGSVLRGRAAEVRVTVRNDGSTPRTGFPVRLLAPGVPVLRGTVDLAPDSDAVWKTQVTFPTAGRSVLTAECAGAGPEFDDRLDTVVEVSEGVKVLVVMGSGGVAEIDQVPAGLAVVPFSGGQGAGSGGTGNSAEVTLAVPGKMPVYTMDRFDVVVIPQLTRLDESEATALVQFVYGGGGLLVGTGPLTDGETLRRVEALLPAQVGSPTDPQRPPSRATVGEVSPVTGFALAADNVLPGALFQRRRSLTPLSRAGVKVLLNAVEETVGPGGQERSALLVEGSYGQGRVMVMGVPLEETWSDLPRSPGFVPFMQSAVRYISGRGQNVLDESGGGAGGARSIRVWLPGEADAKSVSMDGPGGLRVVPIVDRVDRRLQARWSPPSGGVLAPGTYEVRYRAGGRDRVEPVVVRPQEAESDLASSMDSIEEAAKRIGAEVIEAVEGSAEPIGRLKYGQELWPWLLGLGVAALLSEQALARNWTSRSRY